jgi:hypothetical protein
LHFVARLAASAAAGSLALALWSGVGDTRPAFDRSIAAHFSGPLNATWSGRAPKSDAEGAMEYYGGTVFSSVEVVSVLWGPKVDRKTVDGMPGFFKAVVDSTYLDQLAIYDTRHRRGVNGHKGSHQTIERGSFFGQVQITPKHQGTTLTDRQIRRELEYQIVLGNLPQQTANILYMIYFPAGVTIDAFGLQSCTDFSAYHFSTLKHENPSNIFYGVNPDCGYSFDDNTLVSSAQLADAITDNIQTRGANPDFPQAWETPVGFEIGDLCYGIPARLSTKKTSDTVQEVYLNDIAGCGTGNFTSP